jgi:hypothetical protein
VPSINERARNAADPTASETLLRELAKDKAPRVRGAVAANPQAPAGVLRALADDANWKVRDAVASNPSPAGLAAALSSADHGTRGAAVQRQDLDDASRLALQTDPDHRVRETLARVTDDARALASLARDPHPAVRSATLENPALSNADIEMLATDRIAKVRAVAACSRRVHPDTLSRLAEDRSDEVRWAVLVFNPERLDLAAKLGQDSDEMNARQAQAQLENPRQFLKAVGDSDLIC